MPTPKSQKPKNEDDDILDLIEKKFRGLGFIANRKPSIPMPSFPTRLSDVTLGDLQDKQASYAAWREFSEDLLRMANNDVTRLKEDYNNEYNARYLVSNVAGKDKTTEKKIHAEASESVKRLGKELMYAEMYRDSLAAKVESFTNCLAVLSREITLRQGKPM